MRLRGTLMIGMVAVLLLVGLGAKEHKLVDRWTEPQLERRKFKKLLIIAITDDLQARKNFENRFVSHLRGKQIQGVTSYSIVTDLSTLDGRSKQEVLEEIAALKVDGAISVRVVPLKKLSETEWGQAWRVEVAGDGTIRKLIDQTLPLESGKAKKYGVEVALWDQSEKGPIWGGRTNPYTVEQMRKGAAEFVQFVMYALEIEDLL